MHAVGQAGRLRGAALLSLVTLVWGTTFVVIRALVADRADPLPPGVLTLSRFAVATALFLPFCRRDPRLWAAGLELGFWLWCGYATQAIGLRHTTVGRSAFITVLHVVFVPAMTALAGRRVRSVVWLAAAMALGGTALLSYDGAPPNRGDAWTLLTAATYAVYIVRLERYADRLAPSPLTFVQLAVVTALSCGWVAAERPPVPAFTWPVLAAAAYLGVAATAVTTWLSAVGQKTVPGPQASLLYSLEPVWACAFAWLLFAERFGPSGWAGAGLILAAALLSQWPGRVDPVQGGQAASPSSS
jgi:drug/metabolite transporter (DMT)-like permease